MFASIFYDLIVIVHSYKYSLCF